VAAVFSVSLASEPTNQKEVVEANLKRLDQLDFGAYSQRTDIQLFRYKIKNPAISGRISGSPVLLT